ncbi:hypothetical protein B2G74_05720 [Burkholderia sp. A27]|nr:hypothetical protein B2G74_05720 [Burkholderia sp. A27]
MSEFLGRRRNQHLPTRGLVAISGLNEPMAVWRTAALACVMYASAAEAGRVRGPRSTPLRGENRGAARRSRRRELQA